MTALDALISEKVSGEPFAYFFCSGEGEFFPDGTEESSGQVVTASGRHFTFWTDWQDSRLALDEWREMDDAEIACARRDWSDDDEYRDARRQVGLS